MKWISNIHLKHMVVQRFLLNYFSQTLQLKLQGWYVNIYIYSVYQNRVELESLFEDTSNPHLTITEMNLANQP